MQQMIFIAELIAFSTCFGNHYAHHQELESIIQVVAACGIWCFGFQVVGIGVELRVIILPATLMALGLTQSLKEVSTRNISWGVKAAGA